MTEEQMKLIDVLSDWQNGIGFAQGVLMAIRTQAAVDASDILGEISEQLDGMVKDLVQKAGDQK